MIPELNSMDIDWSAKPKLLDNLSDEGRYWLRFCEQITILLLCTTNEQNTQYQYG